MSFSTSKIPLPYIFFGAGAVPYPLFAFLDYLDLLNSGAAEITFVFTVVTLFAPPICFIIGFLLSLKATGYHRLNGMMLNTLGLAALIFMWVLG